MDDNAQNPSVPTINQSSQPTQSTQAVAQPATPTQPVSTHPEQAPVSAGINSREATPIDETEAVAVATDDQSVTPDEISDAADVQHTEVADVQLQEAHPQVEISKELQASGVAPGPDAEKDQLPQEHQNLNAEEIEHSQYAPAPIPAIHLPMDYNQAIDTKKKSKIRDSIKWLAAKVAEQWEKLQVKGDV